jgi:hypothetical protein
MWRTVSDLILQIGDFKLSAAQQRKLEELDALVNENSSDRELGSVLAELSGMQLEIMIADRKRTQRSPSNKERIKEDITRAFLALNSEANAFMEKLFRVFRYFQVVPSVMSGRSYITMIKALSSTVMRIENPECIRKSADEREAANDGNPTIDDIMCYLSDSIIPAPRPGQAIVNQELLGFPIGGRSDRTDSGAEAVGASSAYGTVYLLLLKKRNVAVKVPKVKGMDTLIEATAGFVIMNTLLRNGFDRPELAGVLPFYGVFSCNPPVPIETDRQATLPICASADGSDPVLYTVTKRIDAPTLQTLLLNRRITIDQVNAVVRKVWSLLIVLQGTSLEFVHNDLHPGNIFVDLSDPENPAPTIIDYGLSSFTLGGQRIYGRRDQKFIEFGISLGNDPALRESTATLVSGLVDIIQLVYGIHLDARDDEIKFEYLDTTAAIYGHLTVAPNELSPNWPDFDSFRRNHHILGTNSPLLNVRLSYGVEDMRDRFMRNLFILNANPYSALAVDFLGFSEEDVTRLHGISDEINGWFDVQPPRDFLSNTPMELLKRKIDEL